MSLGRIVGPLWGGITFDVNYRLPYLSGAVVMFITFLVSLIWLPGEGKEVRATVATPQAGVEHKYQ